MKVREAKAGQILYTKGRVPRTYTKNLPGDELEACYKGGFLPGFLMPAWIGGNEESHHSWPGCEHDFDRITTMFYLGPVWLEKSVGGLKKHHLFLFEGNKIGLEGYDFRHLNLMEDV